jgi:DNA-binding response OmpR family regulator
MTNTVNTLHKRIDEHPLLLSLACASPPGEATDTAANSAAEVETGATESAADMPTPSPADTVFVVAQDERHRTRLRRVCANLGRPCIVASVADVIVRGPRIGSARMAIVAANGLDVPLGAVLETLREAGVLSVALYGPAFGSLVHLLALELGFDHVWGDLAHEEALAVLIRHAGQRIQKDRAVRMDDALGDTELAVDTASLTCSVRGVPFSLGISSLYTLKLLLDRAPHPVSRADIESMIPATKVGRIGGSRVVDAHVSRLRQRLREVGADAIRIVAIRGKGYRITTVGSSGGEEGETAAD